MDVNLSKEYNNTGDKCVVVEHFRYIKKIIWLPG
jgi:hypothetical protein